MAEQALRRAAHVAWRQVGDETVVLDLNDGHIYGLDKVGGFFWHALNGCRSTTELLRLAKRPVLEESLHALQRFLDELVELGLLQPTTEPISEPERLLPPPDSDAPDNTTVLPRIIWREPLKPLKQQQFSCAFISGQSPLCNQVPFS